MSDQKPSNFEIRLPLILAITLAAGMFIGQQLPHVGQLFGFSAQNYETSRAAGTVDEVLRYIQAKYVDSVDVEALKLTAINNMLHDLDPHTVYISPEELQQVEEDMSGNFEGIGIEFLMLDDTISVIAPVAGGPSEAAGIRPGDKIVTIEDSLVAGTQIEGKKIFDLLRGPKGSKVRVGILRGHEDRLRQITITRDLIPVNSVEVAYMLDDKTGYLKISRFSARTQQEFMEALQPLVDKHGLQNLVLDLRGNPGGYLNEAVDILSQLFPEGKLLVYTKGRTEERFNYKSSGHAQFDIRNIAVLIDEGSASASEIVAGAIQDWDRGWVIGRRSFGKGLVQEQYPLNDGGALRLTVSRYYTPSGRCIQRDYSNSEAYAHETDRRLEDGELSDPGKIHPSDSTKFYTGMGRVVFGGGGITPDLFIPLDTAYANSYFFAVRPYLPIFAANWLEKQDKNKIPGTLPDFMANFHVSESMMADFVAFAAREGTALKANEYANCKYELQHQLKARIARIQFQDVGMYKVLNDDDPAVEKALKIIQSGESLIKKNGN